MELPSVFTEPAVLHPPRRVWRDWLLLAAVIVAALAEGLFRRDLPAPLFSVASCIALAPVVLWRRTHPLVSTAVALAGLVAADVAVWLGTGRASQLGAMAFVLVMPYAVFRWGSGRAMEISAAMVIAVWAICEVLDTPTLSNFIGGAIVMMIPCGLGLLMRYRADAQERLVDSARARERVELARELHDSVAHHVSAILIQAQAGQAVGVTDPGAAVAALARVEVAASQSLTEMRSLVGALRSPASLAPRAMLRDIPGLIDGVPAGVKLAVVVHDPAESDTRRIGGIVPDATQAAAYRIVQEAITNALRHGRHVRCIDVEVGVAHRAVAHPGKSHPGNSHPGNSQLGDSQLGVEGGDSYTLDVRVSNDGARTGAAAERGYGLLGMAERTHQLGGTFEAGPNPAGGWTVRASFPLGGPAAALERGRLSGANS